MQLCPMVLESMGARCYSAVGFEADDVIASLVHWARGRKLNAVVVSEDKDMLQLIDTGVHVLRSIFEEDLAVMGRITPVIYPLSHSIKHSNSSYRRRSRGEGQVWRVGGSTSRLLHSDRRCRRQHSRYSHNLHLYLNYECLNSCRGERRRTRPRQGASQSL